MTWMHHESMLSLSWVNFRAVKVKSYQSKQELIDAINISLNKYLLEFNDISEEEYNKKIIGVDKTPAENLSYQLGWVSLLLEWEKNEQMGKPVITPKEGFKWNNLGPLYQGFYQTYSHYTPNEMKKLLLEKVDQVIDLIYALTHDELFLSNQRKWATTPAQWPVYKWIHINTVAPFTNFRTQIRKWKKLRT